MLVIPGVAGMCIWSPRLASDSATPSRANVSVRGEAFAQHFIKCFNVHLYENLANEHRATGGELGAKTSPWIREANRAGTGCERLTAKHTDTP